MIDQQAIQRAAIELRPLLKRMLSGADPVLVNMYKARQDVLNRFQPVFSPEHIPQLTAEEFRSFLIPKNNQHWSGLQRFGGLITADMDLLRRALAILVDESLPIEERLNRLLPKSGPMVKRLGRAIITAILLITNPEKYCVINTPAMEAMQSLQIWPDLADNIPFSQRYIAVCEILLALANELQVDFWVLDGLWWGVLRDQSQTPDEEDVTIEIQPLELPESELHRSRFGLERYLQEFMRDNWDSIPELKGWALLEEDGDLIGYEFNTGSIGRIDLLAHHKTKPQWLVIELKRDQSSDDTIGQVLRYMGWVSENRAEPGEDVRGLVICRGSDERLRYALKFTQHVELMLYEVEFHLRQPGLK